MAARPIGGIAGTVVPGRAAIFVIGMRRPVLMRGGRFGADLMGGKERRWRSSGSGRADSVAEADDHREDRQQQIMRCP